MRIFTFLALLVAAIPTSLNAGLATSMPAIPDEVAMFREQWGIVQKARQERDCTTLKGLLIPNGVRIAVKDRSISRAGLLQAANAWNKALGANFVRVVDSVDEANMTVNLVDGIGEDHESQGDIEVFETGDGVFSAQVLVDVHSGNRSLTDREIGAVVTHELGHFLGLDDLPGDNQIMGEFDPDHLVVHPSNDEANAVLNLRNRIKQAIRDIR